MYINSNDATITIVRCSRKSISVQIKSDGIYVRAPLRMSDAEIKQFLHRKRAWIDKHVHIMTERNSTVKKFTYEELHELAKRAQQNIPDRARYYAPIVGVDYGRITIRSQRTRWGSCSSKGNLNFNCLLMLLPDDVVDSVVVHELCHRKHMNHSPAFYSEVEKVFPDYKRCSKWLKENGGDYLSCLP